jgi:hypothetical protein
MLRQGLSYKACRSIHEINKDVNEIKYGVPLKVIEVSLKYEALQNTHICFRKGHISFQKGHITLGARPSW